MLFGEHLSADEAAVKCACGISATKEVHDKSGRSLGWFCQRHCAQKLKELSRQEKLAKAIARRPR